MGKKSSKNLKKRLHKINERYPMDLLEKHPNPIIRFEEKNRRKHLMGLIRKASFRSFADIGCEVGYISERVARMCKEIYCVDLDNRFIETTQKKIRRMKKKTNSTLKDHYIVSDAQDIKIKDDSVDLAFSSHVLEHLPDPRKGMAELVRITRPGGTIIISVPNEKWVLFVKKVLFSLGLSFILGKLARGQAKGHLHTFDKKLIRKICRGQARIQSMRYDLPFFRSINAVLKPIKRRKA